MPISNGNQLLDLVFISEDEENKVNHEATDFLRRVGEQEGDIIVSERRGENRQESGEDFISLVNSSE